MAPRRPRLHLERGTYYARQNGATQRMVFASDADYAVMERMLADLVADGAIELHAYCLLPEQFHLVVTLVHGTLATAMQRLTSRYARRTHHDHGHFFRHRYSAVLIDPQEFRQRGSRDQDIYCARCRASINEEFDLEVSGG